MAEVGTIWWALIALGVGAGVVSGLLGVGSGIIVIPVLTLLLKCPQKAAQGTALAVMVPMALVGALTYYRNPAVAMNLAAIGLIILGAIAGAVLGAEVAGRLPGDVLRKLFAAFIIVVGIHMLLSEGGEGAAASKAQAQAAQASETQDGGAGSGHLPPPAE